MMPRLSDEYPTCANWVCPNRVDHEGQFCDVCEDLKGIGEKEYRRARARGWED